MFSSKNCRISNAPFPTFLQNSQLPPKKRAKGQPEDVDKDYVVNVKQQSLQDGGSRQLRPRSKAKSYAEDQELRADNYMFCDECQLEFVGGCPTHPFQKWDDVSQILKVNQSKLEGAGRGEWRIKYYVGLFLAIA